MPIYHKHPDDGCWHPISLAFFKENDAWTNINPAFFKESDAWDEFYEKPSVTYLQSSEDVPLENIQLNTVLDSAGVDPTKPAIVVLQAGSIIGSEDVTKPALATGDLSGYGRVIFLNYGEVQGAGGSPNGGNGGDAIYAISPIELGNYGWLRGGGGAGGKGGTAPGYTKIHSCSGWRYQEGIWPYQPGIGTGYLWHYSGTEQNVQLLFNSSTPLCIAPFSLSITEWECGGFVYYRGNQTFHHTGTGSRHFEIKQCRKRVVPDQQGQLGGHGQGYKKSKTEGVDDFADYVFQPGVYDAIPGAGGDGGDWGEDGEDGKETIDSGLGEAGGEAGAAIRGGANVHILCSGDMNGEIVA